MEFPFKDSSFRDQETGVYNLNYFMEILFREWHRLLREKDNLSIVIIHPTYLKNEHEDTHKKLAHLLENSTYRATDIVSKFNEEDFLLGLFNLNKQGTQTILDRIQAQLDTDEIETDLSLAIRAVNIRPQNGISLDSVFNELQIMLHESIQQQDTLFKVINYEEASQKVTV